MILSYNEWQDFLNEEFLGRFRGMDIYKNPKSIKKFDQYVRGFIDIEGNMYIADVHESLHYMIAQILIDNGIAKKNTSLFKSHYAIKPWLFELLPIERQSDTNNLHITFQLWTNLSKKNVEFIDAIFKRAKLKHPQFNFIKDMPIQY